MMGPATFELSEATMIGLPGQQAQNCPQPSPVNP